MKLLTLIIIPTFVYEKSNSEIEKYVQEIMMPYSEDVDIPLHVIATAEEVNNEYAENCEDYDNKNEFCEKFFGGQLDENGCVVSTINTNAFWETYKIAENCLKQYDIDDDDVTFENIINCITVKNIMERNICDLHIDIVLSEHIMINKKHEPLFNEKVTNLLHNNKNEYCLYIECQI